jgi:hypothetical protein
MKKVFAKISWTPHEDGGRKRPPQGKHYIAVARFDDQAGIDRQKDAWSVRVDFLNLEDEEMGGSAYGFVHFISPAAPHERLRPDVVFALQEGPHTVAKVLILLTENVIEKLVAQTT